MTRHLNGVASNKECHARNVAVVFAGLVGAAQDHVVDVGGADAAPGNDRFEHRGGKVVGAHARERAAVATEGGAQRLNDPGLLQGAARGAALGERCATAHALSLRPPLG